MCSKAANTITINTYLKGQASGGQVRSVERKFTFQKEKKTHDGNNTFQLI